MGLIRYLLGRTFFPDNDWTRNRDGSPIRPYDMATDTMFEYMGVRVDPVDEAVDTDLQKVAAPIEPAGKVSESSTGYSIDGRLNDSFRAVNQLFDKGIAVRRVDRATAGLRPGDFVVGPGSETTLAGIAKETGVDFKSLRAPVSQDAHDAKRQRVAMYQRYGGGNMDEGWTRLVLEQFSFPYATLMDAELKKGDLNTKYDVIVFPEDSTATITGDRPAAAGAAAPAAGGRGGRGGGGGEGGGGGRGGAMPPEFRTGIGAEGVTALRTFVEKGGTIVTLGGASQFAMDRLGVSVRNVVAGKNSKEFWSPGSTLKIKLDNTNPLAYGMPADALAVYFDSNPAFEVTAPQDADKYTVVARYADRDLLESGWLLGEENLTKRAAVVSARIGEGRVVLIGFRTQHRAQTHGTYKLLFNTLVR
jgi:hypothetical protein